MTTYEQELEDRAAEYTFEDLFGDKIAVGRTGYENHPDVGTTEGVSVQGWDVHLPLVFSAAEARRLGEKLIADADDIEFAARGPHALAEVIVAKEIAEGRLVRTGGGRVIEAERLADRQQHG